MLHKLEGVCFLHKVAWFGHKVEVEAHTCGFAISVALEVSPIISRLRAIRPGVRNRRGGAFACCAGFSQISTAFESKSA